MNEQCWLSNGIRSCTCCTTQRSGMLWLSLLFDKEPVTSTGLSSAGACFSAITFKQTDRSGLNFGTTGPACDLKFPNIHNLITKKKKCRVLPSPSYVKNTTWCSMNSAILCIKSFNIFSREFIQSFFFSRCKMLRSLNCS